ncbi:MAG: glycerophosphodiester phosphodiesterase [Actinobacteria bacterium]|nr:glycerophosphodiester phosphodiesterase [Actinomycetota bacterium]|tara:strand:- start:2826 stop:3536 length:711 start_codon:yes stop_codon:yes gene_type:complete
MKRMKQEKKSDQSNPILFAHRGGRGHAEENTLEAFSHSVSLGVTGLESDVWLSVDGVPVLSHDNKVGSFGRRVKITKSLRSEIPKKVPSLEDLYTNFGNEVNISLDIKDSNSIEATVDVALNYNAAHKLWVCHPDLTVSAPWREIDSNFKLVDSPGKRGFPEGGERRAFFLSDNGFDAINLPEPLWTAGYVELFHKYELKCFAWDAQLRRQIDRLIKIGIDGIYSDHTDRLVSALN